MNERIKELTKQAEGYADNEHLDSVIDGIRSDWHDIFRKKFAELIIQECVKCRDPLVSHYIDAHTEQEQALLLAAIADYSNEIEKHFGVGK